MRLVGNIILLEEMTVKSNLNPQGIGIICIPKECNYSVACDSKINCFREEREKWPSRIK